MTCKHVDIPDGLTIINNCGCAVICIEPTQVVYSYELLVAHFKEHEGMVNPDDPDDTTEAQEWVDYNVVGGLPYATPNPPLIEYPEYA